MIAHDLGDLRIVHKLNLLNVAQSAVSSAIKFSLELLVTLSSMVQRPYAAPADEATRSRRGIDSESALCIFLGGLKERVKVIHHRGALRRRKKSVRLRLKEKVEPVGLSRDMRSVDCADPARAWKRTLGDTDPDTEVRHTVAVQIVQFGPVNRTPHGAMAAGRTSISGSEHTAALRVLVSGKIVREDPLPAPKHVVIFNFAKEQIAAAFQGILLTGIGNERLLVTDHIPALGESPEQDGPAEPRRVRLTTSETRHGLFHSGSAETAVKRSVESEQSARGER